jgi:hypothetical protein
MRHGRVLTVAVKEISRKSKNSRRIVGELDVFFLNDKI